MRARRESSRPPRQAAAGRLLAAACLAAAAGCSEPPPPDVVLISVDTLRADHLGAYAAGARTPSLDAFATEATLFEHCAAPMPLTRPSHFSLLTSRYPREHGVLNNAMALPEAEQTLAETLAAHGYRTGGFVAVRLLGPDSGAAQGFERFEQPEGARERAAEDTVRQAVEWLDGLDGEQPLFLWLHLFDPHLPYAPPEPFRDGVDPNEPELDWSRLMQIAAEHDGDVPQPVLDEARRLYRGEVSYVDHWVGELLAALGRRRPLDETLVVFTADHGECFENGIYFEHADCLWEGALRVPLMIRYPPEFPPGERVDEQTSLVDVAPTILRATGIEPPRPPSGRPLQDRADFGERHVLVEYPFFQPSAADHRPQRLEVVRSVAGDPTTPLVLGVEKVGLVGGGWKYLRAGDRVELYSVAPEVDERTNRAETDPGVAGRLGEELRRQLERHRLNLLDTPEINEELMETLRALGYL